MTETRIVVWEDGRQE